MPTPNCISGRETLRSNFKIEFPSSTGIPVLRVQESMKESSHARHFLLITLKKAITKDISCRLLKGFLSCWRENSHERHFLLITKRIPSSMTGKQSQKIYFHKRFISGWQKSSHEDKDIMVNQLGTPILLPIGPFPRATESEPYLIPHIIVVYMRGTFCNLMGKLAKVTIVPIMHIKIKVLKMSFFDQVSTEFPSWLTITSKHFLLRGFLSRWQESSHTRCFIVINQKIYFSVTGNMSCKSFPPDYWKDSLQVRKAEIHFLLQESSHARCFLLLTQNTSLLKT